MKEKTALCAALTAFSIILSGCTNSENRFVDRTVKSMTLEEKAGQMVQITADVVVRNGQVDLQKLDEVFGKYKVGSILNVYGGKAATCTETAAVAATIQQKSMELIGIPCIYGLDMIHGATYLKEGTFFPQEINLGATFNPEFARMMGEATAYETRAAQVSWMFAPVMDLGRDPRWSRIYESWGEDPYLQGVMAVAETEGAQGNDPKHIDEEHVAVSIKHFMGYGVPDSGKDRTPATITEHDLREKFFRPFRLCLEKGAQTIMVNSASINGIPTHANGKLLTQWTKKELGWDGFIVTDWADINNLYTREHVVADLDEALALGINAGIDMIMDPYDPTIRDNIIRLVREGKISIKRINDAAARIIRVKYRLGLFDNPVWSHAYSRFGCAEFENASRDAAAESEVLLKNDNALLPLGRNARILLTGPNANSIRTLNGGWSYTWQGTDNPYFTEKFNTIKEAFEAKFSNIVYTPGVRYTDEGGSWEAEDASGIAEAARLARSVDVAVICIGENTYCETPGNISDLTLSTNQINLVKAVASSGKPVVLILNGGRPRIISEIEPMADAIVDIMLPGNYGADALAALLCGEKNFSGKLPFTYPKHVHSLHTYDYKVSENVEVMDGMYNYDAVMDVQWPFGSGMSYTGFEYSNLVVDKSEFDADDIINISVDVTNTGSVAGKESVLLFSSDLVASLVPDVKRLRAFNKIPLQPGETATVDFAVPAYELAFVGEDGRWRLEEGDFRLSVGGLSTFVRCNRTKIWNTPNID